MFGLGIGEILIIFILIFLICPKDIPKALKKLQEFFQAFEKVKDELFELKEDVADVFKEDEEEKK